MLSAVHIPQSLWSIHYSECSWPPTVMGKKSRCPVGARLRLPV